VFHEFRKPWRITVVSSPSSPLSLSLPVEARIIGARDEFTAATLRNSGECFRAALPTETRFSIARDVVGRDIKSKLKLETRGIAAIIGDIRADPGLGAPL